MNRASLIAAVFALLALFPVGLWLGLLLKGKHVQFWIVAIVAGVCAAGGVFYFTLNGPSWMVTAPIGAVAGLWTGMKYGYLDGLLGIFSPKRSATVDSEDDDLQSEGHSADNRRRSAR